MYNVLIDAYAVAPNWGSEQGMGWNWVSNLAKFCNLYIITEGEWQKEIEQSLAAAMANSMEKSNNPTGLTCEQAERMHFYYLPVSKEVREMCWNQGTWKFYIYYEQWERRAFEKAKEIIATYAEVPGRQVDVIHKLNMICYREPSYLWKIKDIPFVWGPIGGYAGMPNPYLQGEPIMSILKENVKNWINYITFHFQPRVGKAAKRADAIVGAYKETYEALRDVYRPDTVLINETGAFIDVSSKPHASDKKELNLLWVGKYDLRKQLGIAIRTMEPLVRRTHQPQKNIHLWVVGTGYPKDVEKYSKMVEEKGLKENVHLMGVVPNVKTRELMKEMDLFFFTSVHDATSTVVPEAISAGLPVICHNMRGFGIIVDDKIGRKVQPHNPETSAQEFAKIIASLDNDRREIRKMSAGCIERQREISWEANARKMVNEYEKAIEKFNVNNKYL